MYASFVILLLAVTKGSALEPRMHGDDHEVMSLSLAVNRSFCRVPSALSSAEQIGILFFTDPRTRVQPVGDLIAARWGSLERYCSTVTVPYVNNENSLMLLEAWAWRIAPGLSVVGVGRALLAVKLGLLVFACVAFLRLGAGVLLCFVTLDAALALLSRVQAIAGFATYSFLLCAVVATLALYPLMLSLPSRSRVRQFVWPVIAGSWSAFVSNMRTSYFPLVVGIAVLYACALMLESRASVHIAQRFQRVIPVAVAFVIGYALFQYTFIVRSRPAGSEGLSHHTVFHPLVLSIGFPTNAFSEREGIEWDDAVGLTLAHRVDPSASYLSKEYERALAEYYFGLWKRYPADMIRVYLIKAKLAGADMMSEVSMTDWGVMFAARALRHVPNGVWLLCLLVASTAVSARAYLHEKAPLLMLLMMMGLAAAMLMIESIVIAPRYYVTYHAPLLWLYVSLTFVLVQLAFNGILALSARHRV